MESLVAAANDQHLNAGQSRSYKSYTDRNEAERVRATKATSLKARASLAHTKNALLASFYFR